MSNAFFRADDPAVSPKSRALLLSMALTLVPSCVSYEPAPVDISRALLDLDAMRWPAEQSAKTTRNGVGPQQLSSFAITHNPSLQVLRSRIGVAEALLVEAGLLADPTIGWDGMDVFASQIIDGNSSSVDVLAGFGLAIPLPRPGEIDAKKGVAMWRVEQTRRKVLEAEWVLAREVHVAFEDVLEAERLVSQNLEALRLAETTSQYFVRAKAVGASTAIQENLALSDQLTIQAQRLRLTSKLRDVKQRLNALLGLPPNTTIPYSTSGTARDTQADPLEASPDLLTELSLEARPDLVVLLASYQAAEQEVRLEVARQFPQMSIGTGIELIPGLFTRFNRRAIDTSIARRDALRVELDARIHEVRREIHDTYAFLQESRQELDFLESELLPNAEKSLRLAGQAFDAGEVTLLEILILQRALIDARTRTTQANAELQRRRWRLLSASGTLFVSADAEALPEVDPNETVR